MPAWISSSACHCPATPPSPPGQRNHGQQLRVNYETYTENHTLPSTAIASEALWPMLSHPHDRTFAIGGTAAPLAPPQPHRLPLAPPHLRDARSGVPVRARALVCLIPAPNTAVELLPCTKQITELPVTHGRGAAAIRRLRGIVARSSNAFQRCAVSVASRQHGLGAAAIRGRGPGGAAS